MTTLADRIAALNAQTAEWVSEYPDNRIGGLLTTDLSHWFNCDVVTGEDLDLYLIRNEVYDSYKSAYGFRPDYSKLKGMNMAELEDEQSRIADHVEWTEYMEASTAKKRVIDANRIAHKKRCALSVTPDFSPIGLAFP